jgi:thiamine-monophosphate kinase
MNTVTENRVLAGLVSSFSRSPLQMNGHQESDAELLRFPGRQEVLVLSTDSVVEEIETGLYDDPYLMGWMTVVVNASDLAAMGACPVGILLNETLPSHADEAFLARLQSGIRDACESCGFNVLGGDTNFSSHPQMGATALGVIPDGRVITRRGCCPGDRVFTSGPLGGGSAYAFHQLRREPLGGSAPPEYRPQPRFREGRLVRRFGSAAMDTSDGAIATLDQLMRINEVGFLLDVPVECFLTPEAVALSRSVGIPAWSLLAGPHGEFELIFTVPESRVAPFLVVAGEAGWQPIRAEVDGDVDRYLRELLSPDTSRAATAEAVKDEV